MTQYGDDVGSIVEEDFRSLAFSSCLFYTKSSLYDLIKGIRSKAEV